MLKKPHQRKEGNEALWRVPTKILREDLKSARNKKLTRDHKEIQKQSDTTNNESKKKRDLYSVICVCENDFCTF